MMQSVKQAQPEKTMSADGLERLDQAVHLTHLWIGELDRALGWNDKHRALRLLREVLHGIRDRLPVVENAQLAAQMPTLLRGIYFEQWRPGHAQDRHGSLSRLLERLSGAFREDPFFDPEVGLAAVLDLLCAKVSAGEIEDVVGCLPREIREFWAGEAVDGR